MKKNLPVVKTSPTDHALQPKKIEPTISIEPESDAFEELQPFSHAFPEIASLNQNQRRVLIAMSTNIVAENYKTDTQIAEELGITRRTIYNCRKNPVFARLLSQISIDIVHGLSDKVVSNLLKLAEKDTKANEILARIAEIYVPSSRIASVVARIDASMDRIRSPQAGIRQFVDSYGALGYTVERFIEEIKAEWAKAKEEGRF